MDPPVRLTARPRQPLAQEAIASPAPASRAAPAAGRGLWVPKVARQVLVALLVSALVVMVFNSGSLAQLARSLRIGPVEDGLVRAAEAWHGLMHEARLDSPAATVRGLVRLGEDAGWPDLSLLTERVFAACALERAKAGPAGRPGSGGLRGPHDPIASARHDFAAERELHPNLICYLRELGSGWSGQHSG